MNRHTFCLVKKNRFKSNTLFEDEAKYVAQRDYNVLFQGIKEPRLGLLDHMLHPTPKLGLASRVEKHCVAQVKLFCRLKESLLLAGSSTRK